MHLQALEIPQHVTKRGYQKQNDRFTSTGIDDSREEEGEPGSLPSPHLRLRTRLLTARLRAQVVRRDEGQSAGQSSGSVFTDHLSTSWVLTSPGLSAGRRMG